MLYTFLAGNSVALYSENLLIIFSKSIATKSKIRLILMNFIGLFVSIIEPIGVFKIIFDENFYKNYLTYVPIVRLIGSCLMIYEYILRFNVIINRSLKQIFIFVGIVLIILSTALILWFIIIMNKIMSYEEYLNFSINSTVGKIIVLLESIPVSIYANISSVYILYKLEENVSRRGSIMSRSSVDRYIRIIFSTILSVIFLIISFIHSDIFPELLGDIMDILVHCVDSRIITDFYIIDLEIIKHLTNNNTDTKNFARNDEDSNIELINNIDTKNNARTDENSNIELINITTCNK